MTNSLDNNKRIARNTLLLYFRMGISMIVSLYTSRVVLGALGIEDFGIYNVVGGVVALFSMLTGALSVAATRFITFELGKEDSEKLKDVFSTTLTIHVAMAIIIALLAEIIGIWFIEHKMVLPDNRIPATLWVLQFSIFTFVIGLICVPYNATIVAHERMSAFAYIGLFDVVMKLVIAFTVKYTSADKLIVYAALLAFLQLVMRVIYNIYCRHNFPEAKFSLHYNKKMIKSMSHFIGWAFWGNGVVVLKDQGTNMLLNIFGGPSINAARGICMQVNAAVYSFVDNFLMAVNPQITKSYSSGEMDNMHVLIARASKMAFFIMLLLFFPLVANIDYVLSLWLQEVPNYTGIFVILILGHSLLGCFSQPLVTGVLAEGDIKRYEMALTMTYLACFISSYVSLKLGQSPTWVFIWNIVFKAMVVGELLWHSHVKYGLSIRMYFRKAILPGFYVFVIGIICIYIFRFTFENEFINFGLSVISLFVVTAIAIFYLGLTRNEAHYISKAIKNKLSKLI